ncbi:MAG: ROK family protein [Melioribacteraceae bacterium]|nr:ROK family protein [Melioribacteraceae bacterium]
MSTKKYSVGVDLGGTNIKIGIVSEDGKIIKKDSLSSKADEGPEKVIQQIKKAIKQISNKSKVKVIGIGIGTPGIVSSKKGTVENPPNFPGWDKVPLKQIIKKEFQKDVFIENDANAAAIGELMYGAGKNKENFIMITLGTGVGGGIILDRKIYRGELGAAGEIGHITIDHNGPKCNCGSRGCIEAYAGNRYIISRISKDISNHPNSLLCKMVSSEGKELSPKLIYEAACNKDDYAIGIITDVGKYLGYGIASAVNLLDVTNIIIGGGVAGFGRILFDSFEKTLIERVMKPFKSRINVKPARLKNDAGIKGAASLVFYKS